MSEHDRMKILMPLDTSNMVESVLVSLLPLIKSRRIESLLLHVAEDPETAKRAQVLLGVRRQALESQGVAVQMKVVVGKPSEEILKQAVEGGFDLVAMATHGRSGMDRVLLGSVAEDVVRKCPIPTLLCKDPPRMGHWERIVVALDGMPGAEEVLDDVTRLAKSLHATVHLVRVGPALLREDGVRGVNFRFPDRVPSPYLDKIALGLMKEGIPTMTESRGGFAGAQIAQVAHELDAGLICMTTEGRPENPGMDRSVAAAVIRSAPCPVYVRRIQGSLGFRVITKAAEAK